jgi:hypothetical protein
VTGTVIDAPGLAILLRAVLLYPFLLAQSPAYLSQRSPDWRPRDRIRDLQQGSKFQKPRPPVCTRRDPRGVSGILDHPAITTARPAASPVVVSSAPSPQACANAIDAGLPSPPACPPRRSIWRPIARPAPPAPLPATARAPSQRARLAARRFAVPGSVAAYRLVSGPWDQAGTVTLPSSSPDHSRRAFLAPATRQWPVAKNPGSQANRASCGPRGVRYTCHATTLGGADGHTATA